MRILPEYVIIALIIMGIGCSTVADELDREIIQIKKKIERVTAQWKEEAKHTKEEKKAFEDYKKRTEKKKNVLKQYADSIKTQITLVGADNDSLAAHLQSIEQKTKEKELEKKYIRSTIEKAVQSIAAVVETLPPLIAQQYHSSLHFLETELKTDVVENTEALYRLMRIVHDVRTLSQEIQVVEGKSPVQQLHGAVYRLRIGAFFEALVNMEGTKAFLWCSDSLAEAAGTFQEIDDPQIAAEILKAVRIREGKSIPELVHLPLCPSDTAGGIE